MSVNQGYSFWWFESGILVIYPEYQSIQVKFKAFWALSLGEWGRARIQLGSPFPPKLRVGSNISSMLKIQRFGNRNLVF